MVIGSTLILKLVIALIFTVTVMLCAVVLPQFIRSELAGDFDYGWIFVGMYVSAAPFFFALHQGYRLLQYIDKKHAFTPAAVTAFRRIKNCALIISGLYAAGMPYIFYVADRDDAPGVAAVGFTIIFASFVIAAAAAVFQQLVQAAVDLKHENDLTV